MSLTIATSIAIAAPLDDVWAILTDFGGFARWNPYLIKVEGRAEAGATIIVHLVVQPGAEAMVAPVGVIAVERPVMRWEGGTPDRSQFKGDHWFVLSEADGVTIFDHYEHFSGRLAEGIIGAHRDAIDANFVIFNEALKTEAEKRA